MEEGYDDETIQNESKHKIFGYFTSQEIIIILVLPSRLPDQQFWAPAISCPGGGSTFVHGFLKLPGPVPAFFISSAFTCLWLVLGILILKKPGTAISMAVLMFVFMFIASIIMGKNVSRTTLSSWSPSSLRSLDSLPSRRNRGVTFPGPPVIMGVLTLALMLTGNAKMGESGAAATVFPLGYAVSGILALCLAVICFVYPASKYIRGSRMFTGILHHVLLAVQREKRVCDMGPGSTGSSSAPDICFCLWSADGRFLRTGSTCSGIPIPRTGLTRHRQVIAGSLEVRKSLQYFCVGNPVGYMPENDPVDSIYFNLKELGIILVLSILAAVSGALVPSYLFPEERISDIVYGILVLPGPGAGVLIFGGILCFWLLVGLILVKKPGTAVAMSMLLIAFDLLFGNQVVIIQSLDVLFIVAIIIEAVCLIPVERNPGATSCRFFLPC